MAGWGQGWNNSGTTGLQSFPLPFILPVSTFAWKQESLKTKTEKSPPLGSWVLGLVIVLSPVVEDIFECLEKTASPCLLQLEAGDQTVSRGCVCVGVPRLPLPAAQKRREI